MKLSEVKKNLPENVRVFITLVAEMRKQQKSFFANKDSHSLGQSKKLEKEVDAQFEQFKESDRQPEIFNNQNPSV